MRKLRIILSFVYVFFASFILNAQNSPAPIPYVDFVLTPNHADWNYKIGEEASVKMTVMQYGIPICGAKINYELGSEMLESEKKGTLLLADGTSTLNIGTSKIPGFRQLKVSFEFEGKSYKDQIKVAFSPDKIQPTVKLPTDFISFWDQAKADAAHIPMDARVIYLPEQSTATVDIYLVNLQNDQKGKRLYGYLCKPKAPGKYPVLMTPPGAGVKKITPSTFYADQGFISFSIEIHGISPEITDVQYKDISNAFGDYWFSHLDERDQYYYKSVYLGCVRSIDYLCSLPEFDGKHVVVTGGSQGGALSIVTASLDQRVTALAAFYPALCDLTGYLNGRAGGWPHIFSDKYKSITATPEKINTAAYYDVANFARFIRVPGFYSWGYNDNTCPPTSVFSAINVITAPKEVVITPITGHWRFGETNDRSVAWLKQQCGIQ